jgi:hypothetical protein
MDIPQLLGCVVMVFAGLYLLQLDSMTYRKVGIRLIWLATGVGAYFLSHSFIVAAVIMAAWTFFPMWEMVFVLRQLRVPRHRQLVDSAPPRDEFEELDEITQAVVAAGFQQADECRIRPAQHEQYYRIFVRQDGNVQATIGYVAQGPIGFHFVAFTSHSNDGRRWVTWDYPLIYGLIMPPNTAVYRALDCQEVGELYQAHLEFLKVNEIANEALTPFALTPGDARARLEETLNQQIDYNILRGYLAPAQNVEAESFRYSWRGTLYVARQVLRDMLL